MPTDIETFDKQSLVSDLICQIEKDLAVVEQSQKVTHEGAIHEEAKAEDDKDTRAIESSYLAVGLARRVAELEGARDGLIALNLCDYGAHDPIAVGALVQVEDEGGEAVHYLIAPAGGGRRVESSLGPIRVITPKSPIGRALLGRRTGDDVRVKTPKGTNEGSIISVR